MRIYYIRASLGLGHFNYLESAPLNHLSLHFRQLILFLHMNYYMDFFRLYIFSGIQS